MSFPVSTPSHRPFRVRSAGARALAAEPAERVLLSIKEAAAYLCVSEKTVRRYIDAGVLRAWRFGPKPLLRIELSDLEALMAPAHPAHM
ncbi:helix-turn-helix domain-containing protein [uncultured Microbacterium sp.]|uniref:helix-turn-helix domain-containing protein n=1 Tax=uncultured Microbacterium sp. TaxID=191216 RepID=UPI0028DBAE9D|nr:helix-turn-helix domain-containing protein [uncultured Microbacterium sp.]